MTDRLRLLPALAAGLGFVSVAAGAFGAHGAPGEMAKTLLRTGGEYGLIHALAVFAALFVEAQGGRGGRLAVAVVSTAKYFAPRLIAAGASTVVLTNAAGGIDPDWNPGTVALIRDHINLTATSPLEGPAPPKGYGARFVDLSDLYNARLRAAVRDAVPELVEGVYAGFRGPHYETPAEIAMARTMGASLVGMSTVLEAIAARHLGAEVLGLSLVSNHAAGVSAQSLNHLEVLEAGQAAAGTLGGLLARLVPVL